MKSCLLNFSLSASAPVSRRIIRPSLQSSLFALLLASATLSAAIPASAQTTPQTPPSASSKTPLAQHHPQWATPANDAGPLPAAQPVEHLTVVLARTPRQQAAFTRFLADQQNPKSSSYHHWLTPAQIAGRFGPTQDQAAAVSTWLTSQNLHVDWIAPSRAFVGFGGAAADLGRAFHTQLHSYVVNGRHLTSIASDPVLPAALASSIQSIRGLYTIEDKPQHHAASARSDNPDITTGDGSHFLGPADFNTIYDIPATATGAQQAIGIVGRSRTDFADFDNIRLRTGATFANPTEIVPTAFGGIDPGPAYTTPPPSSVDLGDQLEAELDVLRAGSVAPAASLLLVVSNDDGGGIGTAAQYLVQTTPVPAIAMNISFGACERDAGAADVGYWDTTFQQAAAEGISVFVSSGDAGAAGCDANFGTPPVSPEPISPNYICSSSYATCVGGTEFNDTANPSQYWTATNSTTLESALSYIPEGAWNEPLTSKSVPEAASSGGGVSQFIPTPAWQTGPGVPAARAGRYTPDLAFSASGHDGYFACFAAAGASCVADSNGEYEFEYFYGTSAAAPSMAGIAALLAEHRDIPQGNLNPELYALAGASPPSLPLIFNDVTVATSGVSACVQTTPSMCNNSVPGHTTITGGETGYLVNDGYDEVTGLGSIDVGNLLASNAQSPSFTVSTASITFPDEAAGGTATEKLTVQVGNTALDSFSVSLSGDSVFTQTNTCTASLAAGAGCTISIVFKPIADGDYSGSLTLTASNVSDSTVVAIQGSTANPTYTPNVTVTANPTQITVSQSSQVQITVAAPQSAPAIPVPTGSVTVTSGSYSSSAIALTNGAATVSISGSSLATGSNTLLVTYTPDAAGTSNYVSATGSATITVAAPPAIALTATSVTLKAGAATGNTSTVTVTPSAGFTGSVTLAASVTSSPTSAVNPPTVSFGSTGTVAITGATAGTATLTLTTLAPSSPGCTNTNGRRQQASLHSAAGPLASLACLLFVGFFAIPARRRAWRSLLGIVLLLAACTAGITACGGNNGGIACPTVIDPGTTTGNYTITVTGTSGALSTSTTLTLTVQ